MEQLLKHLGNFISQGSVLIKSLEGLEAWGSGGSSVTGTQTVGSCLQPPPTELLPPRSLTDPRPANSSRKMAFVTLEPSKNWKVQVHLVGCVEFTSRIVAVIVAVREPGKWTFSFFHPCGLLAGTWKKAGMDPIKGCCQTQSWVKSANQQDLTG